MFFTKPGAVEAIFTVAMTDPTPVQARFASYAIIPAVARVRYAPQSIDGSGPVRWTVEVQGGRARKNGTAGDSVVEHKFYEDDDPPASVAAVAERFRAAASAAIEAGTAAMRS